MKSKLFDYIDRDNFIFNLSGLTKLVCFIGLTFAVMFSYDIRYILFVMVLSVIFFAMSGLQFKHDDRRTFNPFWPIQDVVRRSFKCKI